MKKVTVTHSKIVGLLSDASAYCTKGNLDGAVRMLSCGFVHNLQCEYAEGMLKLTANVLSERGGNPWYQSSVSWNGSSCTEWVCACVVKYVDPCLVLLVVLVTI